MRETTFLQSFLIIATALIVTVLCLTESMRGIFPISWVAKGSFVMDTLFHELGHSVFGWLFGNMNIPMIFTVFHADKMGGMAMSIGHSIFVQIGMVLALIYWCYYVRTHWLFIPSVIFTIIIAAFSASGYGMLLVNYMGHGSAILMGGFFLFRAFANIAPRGKLERWLNAYFGLWLLLNNMVFSYRLMSDKAYYDSYTDAVEFIGHRDFVKVGMELSMNSTQVAFITLIFAGMVMVASAVFGVIRAQNN